MVLPRRHFRSIPPAPIRAIGMLCVLSLVAACRPAPAAHARLHIVFASAINIGDLTSLAANRALRGRGYDVEETFLATPELATAALARGDADIAIGGASAYWVANHKGADLRMLVSRSDNGYQLVARAGITQCGDLDQRPVAASTRGSLPTALLTAFLSHCPSATAQLLSIPSSNDRLAALSAGRVDAALLQRQDAWHLRQRASGRFTVVEEFNTHVPGLRFIGAFASARYINEHRPILVEWVREKVAIDRRALSDRQVLLDEAGHWPAMAATEPELMDAEIAAGAWDRDGGLTTEAVEAAYRFFVNAGIVDGGLPPAALADLSLLDDALKDLGGRSVVAAPADRP